MLSSILFIHEKNRKFNIIFIFFLDTKKTIKIINL